MRRAVTFVALLGVSFWVGCNQKASSSQTNEAASSERTIYHTRGVVKEIISPTKGRIQHEAIPGYMPAMTMPLDAKNTNEFAGVKAGDHIKFDMVIAGDDGWIEKVQRDSEAAPLVIGDTNKGVTFSKPRAVELLSVGD